MPRGPMVYARLALATVTVAAISGALAAPAAAKPADAKPADAKPADAKARKKAKKFERKGKQAYKKGRWGQAVVAFELAYAADPRPKYLYNVAQCQHRDGRFPEAVAAMRRYLLSEIDEDERSDAEAELAIFEAELRKTHAWLTAQVEPGGATVRWMADGRAPVEVSGDDGVWLAAGSWTLHATKTGYERLERPVDVAAGRDQAVKLTLAEPGAAPQAKTDPAPPGPAERPAESNEAGKAKAAPQASRPRTDDPEAAGQGGVPALAWAGFGLAAVGAVGAVALGLKSSDALSQRDAKRAEAKETGKSLKSEITALEDDATTAALLANVAWGVAGLGLAAGLGLWWLTDDASLRPVPGGLLLEGAW